MEEYWMRLALVICDDGAALGIKVPLIIQVIEAERRRLTVCQNRAQQWCFTRRNKVTAAFQVFVYRSPSADYFMSSERLKSLHLVLNLVHEGFESAWKVQLSEWGGWGSENLKYIGI
ncbi:hypothetical protein QC760_010511 [Botrytis cinerea]